MFKLIYFLLKNRPSIRFVNRFRMFMYKPFFRKSGENNTIGRSINIANIHNIELGSNVVINAEVYLVASDSKICIGNNVQIAPRVVFQTQNHKYIKKDVLISNQGVESDDIRIGDDVWIGLNVIILPGITIEKGCVIGAGSIVTKNTEPYGVYVGIPAKRIKERI